MLLKSYKNILPASIAFVGGMIFAVGQPEVLLANVQVGYTPTDRPKPQRTQGGGSRLYERSASFLQLANKVDTATSLGSDRY
ncbi:MAG: hypothetical protein DCF19_20430 [Pseudanabaena frigida]|uniref:Uncharacterized protein n=1 Tax=Pseudanabaena frigida TaxID=945775 RepID=A0A2W4XZV1_9CYAN|nr:MAG: hypothetical protein DCF19_20430 [Pseudanabaena frigida]